MNCLLEVCLVGLTLTAGVTPYTSGQSPRLQKGIHVKMAVTQSASPRPAADQPDALVVAVTRGGRAYLGAGPVGRNALEARLKTNLSGKLGKSLFIKADAHTRFANVVKVLSVARAAGAGSLILLTDQRIAAKPGGYVPPYGLRVKVGPASHHASEAAVIQVSRSSQQGPGLKINNEHVPWPELKGKLSGLLTNGSRNVVLVKAGGALPFSDVVKVIDASRSMGAEVVLVKPER